MLSEISRRKTNTICHHLHVESKKHNIPVNITKRRLTHKYRKQTTGDQYGEGATRGGGVKGTIGCKIDSRIYGIAGGTQPIFYKCFITVSGKVTSKNCVKS